MIPARLLVSLASSVLSEHLPNAHDAIASHLSSGPDGYLHILSKRAAEKKDPLFIVSACLIPVLVILSGVFAGLTLGYMSLDETQLNVLSISGTAKQKEYANKIKPIRKDGHLLLVTLLLANMIVNETLPVISDPVLGGGVQSVIVSTVLIVLFAEIIPQSVCTRHGLYIGAKMAGPTRILIYGLGIIAWPVAKLLEFVLGPHHGIIYRRGELKELIAMHASDSPHGGDLREDTVTIIGATLDLEDKTVRQAMTPIEKVFMLSIDAKLDYNTLRKTCATGHSRIPIFDWVEVNVTAEVASAAAAFGGSDCAVVKNPASGKKATAGKELVKMKVKKIIGILLVKQCVLLDPEDAVPVRKMRLNKVPFVPQNEPLLGMLDRFQEGRSHMAIVSRMSTERAQSVKKAVKKGLTHRLLGAILNDSSSDSTTSSDSSDDEKDDSAKSQKTMGKKNSDKGSGDESDHKPAEKEPRSRGRKKVPRRRKTRKGEDDKDNADLEKGDAEAEALKAKKEKEKQKKMVLEQHMPADAVLAKENAMEFLQIQGIDPAVMPLGIITLEDVLEELIGEEIYDEFDAEGTGAHSQYYVPPGAHPDQHKPLVKKNSAPELALPEKELAAAISLVPSPAMGATRSLALAMPKPSLPSLKTLGFLRSRSAPPTPRDGNKPTLGSAAAASSGAGSGAVTPTSKTSPNSSTVAIAQPKIGLSGAPLVVPVPFAPPALVTTNSDGEIKGLAQIAELPSPGDSPVSTHGGKLPDANAQPEKLRVEEGPSPSLTPPSATLGPKSASASGVAVAPVPSVVKGLQRSSSPVPSLEAILLERKRRAQMAGGVAPGMASSVPASIQLGPVSAIPGAESVGSRPGRADGVAKTKGGFKSSPLSPQAESPGTGTGIVVAEAIKKQKQQQQVSDANADDSKPSEDSKKGPDKTESQDSK